MPVRIEAILECQNYLGEGPVWDVEEARLYWVDGTGRPGEQTRHLANGPQEGEGRKLGSR